MPNKSNLCRCIASVSALPLLLTACGGTASSTDAQISLGVVVDPAWGQVPVAEEFELFDEAGVDVKVVNFSSGADAMEGLSGGAVDVVTAADVPTSAAIVASDDVRVLAQGAFHDNMRFVADARHGIEEVSDLKGHPIGTALGTSAHYMAATSLSENDVAAELIQVAPPEMQTAMERGDIDAAAIFEPYATQITESLGDDAVVLNSDPPYTSLVYYNTRAEVLESKRYEITRMLAALDCASTLLQDGNQEAVKSVGDATGLEGSTLEGVLSGYTYELSLDDEVGDSLHTLASWAVDEGNIPEGDGLPDFSASLDDGALADSSEIDDFTCPTA